jgi:hypothetical protein
MAIRMFQGLQAAPDKRSQTLDSNPSREMIWRQEVQRRTVWACYIMDRLVSCGKNRPTMLGTKDMTLNLPSSEDDFDFGTLSPSPINYTQLVDPTSADFVSKFTIGHYFTTNIRSLDIWYKACTWVANGGRRQASVIGTYPWEPTSTWHQLKIELDHWRNGLHVRLKYPQTPLSIYLHRRQAEHFAFINLIYYLTYVLPCPIVFSFILTD